jgi:nickel-dependent lactate racemase
MNSRFGKDISIQLPELRELVFQYLDEADQPLNKVLLLPPDHTRLNSMAGTITAMVYGKLVGEGSEVDILPALGTHNPMTEAQLRMMFGDTIPLEVFKVHDWRNEVVCKGTIGGDALSELSDGKLDYAVDVEVNKRLFEGYDMILSIGQVVPHEVVGMANYTKNIVVGVGGSDLINKSHFLGAVSGIEATMGRTDTPVRKLFNRAADSCLSELPIHYILTVMELDYESGEIHQRGFYAGEDVSVFEEACKLSRAVNITLLDREPKKVVVYLDPHEFQSTWLGNKSVYRTRMAIADDGDLIVLAPALNEFGEDPVIDRLIRKFGYCGTTGALKAVEEDEELRDNLGAAAHLMAGSSDGRFRITYCPGEGGVTLNEIRSVGYEAEPYDEVVKRYDPKLLKDGFNILPDGEEIFFVSNPALGLWAFKEKFKEAE